MREGHDVHREPGIAPAKVRDNLVHFIRVGQANEDMRQLSLTTEEFLRIRKAQVDKVVLRAVSRGQNTANCGRPSSHPGQIDLLTDLPTALYLNSRANENRVFGVGKT